LVLIKNDLAFCCKGKRYGYDNGRVVSPSTEELHVLTIEPWSSSIEGDTTLPSRFPFQQKARSS